MLCQSPAASDSTKQWVSCSHLGRSLARAGVPTPLRIVPLLDQARNSAKTALRPRVASMAERKARVDREATDREPGRSARQQDVPRQLRRRGGYSPAAH
ncbi:hypothetical protein A0H81_14177 [Grifola frondosa]|uniref:Uncharacterized protein n=1 Tax=Grifola frondosa TaxID=5627 RepID=A0A1C7LMF2_GRIFR|nr:hypothetical protein A0H81_14177 [Grifola frondosa]